MWTWAGVKARWVNRKLAAQIDFKLFCNTVYLLLRMREYSLPALVDYQTVDCPCIHYKLEYRTVLCMGTILILLLTMTSFATGFLLSRDRLCGGLVAVSSFFAETAIQGDNGTRLFSTVVHFYCRDYLVSYWYAR